MFCKQECIPVGCIPTAAVAASTCSPSGSTPPSEDPQRPPWKLTPYEGTWYQTGSPAPREQNDRRFWKHYLPLRSVIGETHIATESPGAATITAALVGDNTLVSISGLQREQRDPFRTKLCQFHVVFPENLTTLWDDTPFIYWGIVVLLHFETTP